MRCQACGTANRDAARFCDGCGARLDAASAPDTRRTVTVLFVDVVGSTALGERLDPEEVRRTMSELFDLVRTVVERHGGMVEKFIGDAAMAVFGLPTLHEDDAQRAVRAAAGIRNDLAGSSLARSISIRIGVNTGEVVAGDPASGQRLVTGDAVNTAARLEQAAVAGEILLGSATHQLVRDSITADETAPIDAQGKTAPIRAWRLHSVEDHGEVAPRRLDAPLVGRQRELTRLLRSFDDVAAERRCGLFTLLGPAGVGKSRLVHEFVMDVRGRATVIRGRCLPYGEGITFWPIGEIVRSAAGVADEDERDAAVDKLAAVLEGETDADRIVDLVATAIGLRDGDADRDQLFWAFRRLFEWLATDRPLVVVIDDLHWAEPTLLDLVEQVADLSRRAPILLLVIARPDLLDVRPGWAGGKIDATTMLLEPLADDDARHLAARLLAGSLDAELVTRVTDIAEGNPLFVEQIVAMLSEGSTGNAGDAVIDIPPTIQALLAARLDRLPVVERRLAERASVVGRVFERVAVSELSPADEVPAVTDGLRGLVRRELIRPDPAAQAPDDVFRFRHLLIRDAAYESVSKGDRAALHARFADWLERSSGDRLVEVEEIVGYHLEQAHRYRVEIGSHDAEREALAARAAEHLLRAARRAYEHSDARAAIALYERARSLIGADHPSLVAELPILGIAHSMIGDTEAALSTLRQAQVSARAVGDRSAELRSRVVEVDLLRQTATGNFAETRTALESIVPEAIAMGDRMAAARALAALADMDREDGLMARALEEDTRGLEQARAAGHRREIVRQLHGVIVALVGGPTPIRDVLPRCGEIVREAAIDPVFGALCQSAYADALARGGDAVAAHTLLATAQETVDRLGVDMPIAIVSSCALAVERILGAPLAAEHAARRHLVAVQRLQARGWGVVRGYATGLLAETLWDQGRQPEARALVDEALAAGTWGGAGYQAEFHRIAARILATDGEGERAEAHLAEAMALLAPSDALGEKGELALAGAQVAAAIGRRELAAERAAEAERLFALKGDVSSLARISSFRQRQDIRQTAIG